MQFEEYKGQDIYDLAKKIFPYCRSITGQGVRDTLADLSEYIRKNNGPELKIHEVPSGTTVFDWTVPKEWSIKEAYIEDENGSHVIDMKENNLHVMGYSTAVDKWVGLDELKKHIYTQKEQPDVIPYVTSYYNEKFGFCMSENQKNLLTDGRYHMYIDSKLFEGNLTYGEAVIPGETRDEIFFSTYICHPSMANNECSGPALAAELINLVNNKIHRRYTYRFVFIPETIGSITYLSKNLGHLKKHMKAGFVLSCVGDNREYSMVESKYGNTLADKVLENVLSNYVPKYKRYSFLYRGSDERQYNAVGVDLPVAAFCRSKYGEYPEYHTSSDDMMLVSANGFQGSFEVMEQVIETLEHNFYYKINIICEPQLGKRGLYPTISQKNNYDNTLREMTNFIAYADGRNDLIDISNLTGTPVNRLLRIVDKLKCNNMLEGEIRMSKQETDWTNVYQKRSMAFPSEYVIRMFKGKYPKCNLQEFGRKYEESRILDISCGDGRDFVLFNQLGFKEIAGTEISLEIVKKIRESMKQLEIETTVEVGKNNCLPFEGEYFDYVLSWNVCYYFDDNKDFSSHVKEYARVMKKDGVLVFSIPKPNCFIYKNAIPKGNGLMEITSDPFEIRNGTLLKCFQSEAEIEREFGENFYDFTFGSIEDDCFGLNYSWYIGYCRKK